MHIHPLVYIPILLAVLWLFIRFFEWRNIYYPSRVMDIDPSVVGLPFEEVTFVAEDDCVLYGWWIEHKEARGTIIHCHGNAGTIAGRVGLARDLHRLKVNVFLFDYRGYGRSKGFPTEQGTYRDARAAYEVVRAKYEDREAPPIIVHGQSLGCAVAVQLAKDKPVKGLIVESAFSSVPEMARYMYPSTPLDRLCRFKYDSIGKVTNMVMPKLFAHSIQDETIPYELGRNLFDAAAQPKAFVELQGSHNEAGWDLTPEYWRAVETFVDQCFGPAP